MCYIASSVCILSTFSCNSQPNSLATEAARIESYRDALIGRLRLYTHVTGRLFILCSQSVSTFHLCFGEISTLEEIETNQLGMDNYILK